MRKFFPDRIEDGIAYFSVQESRHISRVLRMEKGDKIIVPEGRGEWICELDRVFPEECTARTLEFRGCDAEPKKNITLYMAYTKSDKMEIVVQKSVELGVSRFSPFISSRCVKVPDEKSALKANERFSRIALEAVKQCGRSQKIRIDMPISFDELIVQISRHQKAIFAYEASDGDLKEALKDLKDDVCVIIGPEGGFSCNEADRIVDAGADSVSLGARILRAETAAIALLAITAYEMGC